MVAAPETAGSYAVTVTGTPAGDSASATVTVAGGGGGNGGSGGGSGSGGGHGLSWIVVAGNQLAFLVPSTSGTLEIPFQEFIVIFVALPLLALALVWNKLRRP
jgi:hypothetical protein